MAEEKKTHEGHRQRMRKRVEQQGFDSLEPHEALEYLLYITNARKDTNQLAHDLMGRFGDFAGVLEATEEDLLTVEGVGPATARMLHLLPAVSRYYTQCRTNGKICFKTTEQLAVYLLRLFAGAEQERALLLALDGRSRIKATLWLKDGTGDRVSLAHQGRGGRGAEGRHGQRGALPQPSQRHGPALAGGHSGHREHRAGAGAGPGASAGPHHPDRERVLLHAG